MKKSLLALAALGAFAGAAHAQSSVTLYGIIDAGLTYVNNNGTGALIAAQQGVLQGSRWGLKGSEDLGSGLKTIFQIESGFNTYTGRQSQGGLAFGRQAYVGLSDTDWGTVTLGRQYDSIDDYVQPTTMNGFWGAYFSHAGDIDNTNNAYRVNNAFKYSSPSFNGLTFGGMYAFGGIAGQFGQNSMFGVGTAYANGPIYVAAAYEYARNPGAQFVDGNFVANPTSSRYNPATGGAFGYVGSPANSQIVGVGGTYTFGPAKIGLDYTNTRFGNALGTNSSITFNSAELWGQYSITPAATLIAGYTYVKGKANYTVTNNGVPINKPSWNQFNLMADYALSKRTDVYAMGVFETASGGALANIYQSYTNASSTKNQTLLRLGIRTKF